MRKLFTYLLVISFIFSISGCGKTELDLDKTELDVGNNNKSSDFTDGRYSDDSDNDSNDNSAEAAILAAPEVADYSEREIILPEFTAEKQEQTVTLMIYMVGSDLESKSGAATKDMEEMAGSGLDLSKVNLLIYTGGCEQWFSDISNEKNCIYQLTEDGYTKIKEYTAKSMGDPSCLSNFLNFSYKQYQTDSYNLILWDHGNGPVMGYGKDRLYEGDSMSLKELSSALLSSPFGENNKLGFIGFDACLMSSAELACTVADYADYLVASQEVEPNFGWNYSFLKDCGSVTNESLAKSAVHDYITACDAYFSENENFCSDVTLACMDLSYASELRDSINTLFEEASTDVSGSYNTLALERYHSRAFGRATTGSEYDLVDINSLMEAMSEKYLVKTQSVQNVIDKMVCYSGNNTTDCCGMSLYYPYFNKKHFSQSWREDYKAVNQFPEYQKYLSRFEQIWLGTDMMSLFTEPLSPEEYTPGTYSLELTDEQLECFLSGGYYILRREGDGVYSAVSYSEDVNIEDNRLIANYDGRTLMVSDDYGTKYNVSSVVTDVVDEKYYHSLTIFAKNRMKEDYLAYPLYEMVSGEVQLEVDHSNGNVSLMGYYELSDEDTKADAVKTGKKVPLDTDKYMVLGFAQRYPKYPQRYENGVLKPVRDWLAADTSISSVMSVENGIHFSYEPLYDDDAEYFLMFDILDNKAEHFCSELMPISLAKAPEIGEKPITTSHFSWTDYDNPPVIKDANAEITICESVNVRNKNTPFYGLLVKNNNDFPIEITIRNLAINGKYSHLTERIGSYAIMPGYVGETPFSPVEQIVRYSGEKSLRKLQYEYQLTNELTGKIVSDWKSVIVDINENITPHVLMTDFYGVTADQQILLDNDMVTVELLDFGHFVTGDKYDRDSIHIKLKLTNNTDEKLYYNLERCRVNGYSYDLRYMTTAPGDLLPDDSIFLLAKSDRLLPAFVNKGIVSFDITASVGYGSELTMPVKIDYSGTPQLINNDLYPCVYEDDYVKIYDYGAYSDNMYSSTPIYRCLIAQNKTDMKMAIHDDEFINMSDNPKMTETFDSESGYIDPKGTTMCKFKLYNGKPEEAMGFRFKITTTNTADEQEQEQYVTSEVMLESLY